MTVPLGQEQAAKLRAALLRCSLRVKFLVLDGHFNLGEPELPPSPPNRRTDGQETVSLLRRPLHPLHMAVGGCDGMGGIRSDPWAASGSRPRSTSRRRRTKGPRSLPKPYAAALLRRVEAPQPGQPTPGQYQRQDTLPEEASANCCTSAMGAPRDSASALQRNMTRALARATNGRSRSEISLLPISTSLGTTSRWHAGYACFQLQMQAPSERRV